MIGVSRPNLYLTGGYYMGEIVPMAGSYMLWMEPSGEMARKTAMRQAASSRAVIWECCWALAAAPFASLRTACSAAQATQQAA